MILTKIVSSLEKCFLDDNIDTFAPLTRISALKNERLSMQLLRTAHESQQNRYILCKVVLGGTLAPYASIQTIRVNNPIGVSAVQVTVAVHQRRCREKKHSCTHGMAHNGSSPSGSPNFS